MIGRFMWRGGIAAALVVVMCGGVRAGAADDPEAQKLAREVSNLGWLVFTGMSEAGDYDLFVCRPDGSKLRNITKTPQYNENNVRFSPDGKQILYRRIPKAEHVHHTLHGQFGELVTCNSDGSNVVVHGKSGEFPWASWSPDGKQIACLYKKEGKIRIFELETKKLIKEMPRYGVFQQLYWSPDGKRLCGCANVAGADWNIIDIELATEKVTLVSRDLNCTPDYFHDNQHIIHSHRQPGLADGYGWTMLMQASVDGKDRKLVYGQRNRHVYWSCVSPDDKYAIFSIFPEDNGIDGEMAIVRLADTPMVVSSTVPYTELENLYPGAKHGPVLHLTNVPKGFEPHWTAVDIQSQ
jgi:Tol biopolymer transport system component